MKNAGFFFFFFFFFFFKLRQISSSESLRVKSELFFLFCGYRFWSDMWLDHILHFVHLVLEVAQLLVEIFIVFRPVGCFTVELFKFFIQFHQILGYFPSLLQTCLLYTSPSPRDLSTSRMPSSA
eukprot:TRINITY_DN3565_c0_g1_i5.p1 TRINITY_DN3565_c0_g1~~TRINITY_DN3565_c0_g1_i5.p1  ORF type:complete len:124 (-),score=21.97 TRINITY_DN3565_c0_g1_i5:76-447(-)